MDGTLNHYAILYSYHRIQYLIPRSYQCMPLAEEPSPTLAAVKFREKATVSGPGRCV